MKKVIMGAALAASLLTTQATASNAESWYLKAGLGYAKVSYPGDVQDALDTLKNLGASSTSVAVDVGVYWPLNNQTLLGININGVGDKYSLQGYELQVNSYLYALSGIYNFNKIRDGFFVRGDIGLAKASITTNYGFEGSSDTGYGLGLGLGYSWEFDGWGISPEVLYTSYTIEDETYSSSQFLINFMF